MFIKLLTFSNGSCVRRVLKMEKKVSWIIAESLPAISSVFLWNNSKDFYRIIYITFVNLWALLVPLSDMNTLALALTIENYTCNPACTKTFNAHASMHVLEFFFFFSLFASMISMVLNYLFELISHSFSIMHRQIWYPPARFISCVRFKWERWYWVWACVYNIELNSIFCVFL